LQQGIVNKVQRLGVLVFLAIRQNHWHAADTQRLQRRLQIRQIQRRYRSVGDDGDTPTWQMWLQ